MNMTVTGCRLKFEVMRDQIDIKPPKRLLTSFAPVFIFNTIRRKDYDAVNLLNGIITKYYRIFFAKAKFNF